jgi:hypothetical protein
VDFAPMRVPGLAPINFGITGPQGLQSIEVRRVATPSPQAARLRASAVGRAYGHLRGKPRFRRPSEMRSLSRLINAKIHGLMLAEDPALRSDSRVSYALRGGGGT